jgi:hypothetical protein
MFFIEFIGNPIRYCGRYSRKKRSFDRNGGIAATFKQSESNTVFTAMRYCSSRSERLFLRGIMPEPATEYLAKRDEREKKTRLQAGNSGGSDKPCPKWLNKG